MKQFIIYSLILLLIGSYTQAQEVNGKILINGKENTKIELKSNEIVDLYALLRGGGYAINFEFEGKKLPTTTAGKQVSIIQFTTTVKHNGKIIKSVKRAPMPFFPGSMFIPIEAFDLISILTTGTSTKGTGSNSKFNPGKYEVIFEANSMDAKGAIKPATLTFDVR